MCGEIHEPEDFSEYYCMNPAVDKPLHALKVELDIPGGNYTPYAEDQCPKTTTTTTTTTGAAVPSSSASPLPSSSLSTGQIAGAASGGVLGVIGITAAAMFFIKKKRVQEGKNAHEKTDFTAVK